MAVLTELPDELLMLVISSIANRKDLSSFSRCCCTIYQLAADALFRSAFSDRFSRQSADTLFRSAFLDRFRRQSAESTFTRAALHAIKHDSPRLIRWLTFHQLGFLLNGFVPMLKEMRFTFLHYAIISDAPKVAAYLVKHGTDIYFRDTDYPDLTPLYLAIAIPRQSSDLDGPLRVACSYALPRTCEHLLIRGADPNKLSKFGLAAIHLAIMRRLPWRHFQLISQYRRIEDSISQWEALLYQTVATLLHFGGEANLKSATTRLHSCGYQCWRSLDCDHPGQSVLHFASASGLKDVISLLLKHGANPEIRDDGGYLPLYPALAQDHHDVALFLLRECADPTKLIAADASKSSALHIACRFASEDIVLQLLRSGANTNVIDIFGRTPFQELLSQNCPALQSRTLRILQYLTEHEPSINHESFERKATRRITAKRGCRTFRALSDVDHRILPAFTAPTAVEEDSCSSSSDAQDSTGFPYEVLPATTRYVSHRSQDIDNREPFPQLNGSMAHRDSFELGNSLGSLWFDDKRRERLLERPPASKMPPHEYTLRSRKANPNLVETRKEPFGPATSTTGPCSLHSQKFWSALADRLDSSTSSSTIGQHLPVSVADNPQIKVGSRKKWVPLVL